MASSNASASPPQVQATAAGAEPPAPAPTTTLRTAFHVEEEKQLNAFKDDFCKSFLMGLRDESSPVSQYLAGLSPPSAIFREILDYAKPDPPEERQFYYKIGLVLCGGTEHVHLEALEQPQATAFTERGIYVGSLMNQPIASAKHCGIMIPFLKRFAWKQNEDGSWWNEGQLRVAWEDFCVPRFCDQPVAGHCNGTCCALKGDTIGWRRNEYGYPTSVGLWKPASQVALVERGFVKPSAGLCQMGELYQHAKLARDDPSQLVGSDDDEDDSGDENGGGE